MAILIYTYNIDRHYNTFLVLMVIGNVFLICQEGLSEITLMFLNSTPIHSIRELRKCPKHPSPVKVEQSLTFGTEWTRRFL